MNGGALQNAFKMIDWFITHVALVGLVDLLDLHKDTFGLYLCVDNHLRTTVDISIKINQNPCSVVPLTCLTVPRWLNGS